MNELQSSYKKYLEYVKSENITPASGPYHYLYQITNNLNGRIYIGRRSTDIEPHLDNYMGSGVQITRAINKYGIENFTKEIVHYCETFEELCALEFIIVNEKFINKPETYNLKVGGLYGHNLSEETKNKISETSKLRVTSESTKKKLRLAKVGFKNPESQKLKVREKMLSQRNRPWKTPMAKTKPHCMNLWLSLDKIYKIYLKYDLNIRGNKARFFDELYEKFHVYENYSVLRYFEKYGDPKTDNEWQNLINGEVKDDEDS